MIANEQTVGIDVSQVFQIQLTCRLVKRFRTVTCILKQANISESNRHEGGTSRCQ
jgi:hypothetical protein